MDIKEFHPGRKVFILAKGNKIKGTAGYAFSDRGQETIVRFDNDQFGHVVVTADNARIFHSEPLN